MKKNKISKNSFLNLLFNKIFLFVLAIAIFSLIAIGADVIMKSGQLTIGDDLVVYGKVGIGTKSPGYELYVAGTTLINSETDGKLNLQDFNAGNTEGEAEVGGKNYIQFRDGQGDIQGYFGIDNDGYFQIGNEIPGANLFRIKPSVLIEGKLDVAGSVKAEQLCMAGTCRTEWPWIKSGDNIYSNAVGNVGIGTGTTTPTQKLDVRGNTYISGNVGIGTTTPQYKLDVAGSVNAQQLCIDRECKSKWLDIGTDNDWAISSVSVSAVGGPSSFSHNIIYTNPTDMVGIGTTTPSKKLDVAGDALIGKTNARHYLKISSSQYPEIRYQTPTDDEVIRLGVAHAADSTYKVSAGDWYVYSSATNRMDLIVPKAGGVHLAAGGGNVGIGTTNPKAKLSISEGSGDKATNIYDDHIYFARTWRGTEAAGIDFSEEIAALNIGSWGGEGTISLNVNPGTALHINKFGNVGIGTTNPGAKLTISEGSGNIATNIHDDSVYFTRNYDGSEAAGISFSEGTSALNIGSWSGLGTISLNVNLGTALHINPSTNVGIGTTNPGYKLHVYKDGWKARFQGTDGYIDIGPANSGWAHIYSDRPNFIFNKNVWSIPGGFSSYSSANLYLQTNGVNRVTILNSNGNVGIGTENPQAKLHITGTMRNDDFAHGQRCYVPLVASADGNIILDPRGCS